MLALLILAELLQKPTMVPVRGGEQPGGQQPYFPRCLSGPKKKGLL